MTPQISVVMPVRDGARWLGEAITSVQGQTLDDFELVIVDDGSADDSASIVAASAQRDPRIRAIRQEPLGLVAALNRGLKDARAPLIARLDADDRAHPQRLQRQKQYLDNHPEIGLVGTWADRIDEQGTLRGSLKPATRPEDLAALLARTNPFLHSSVMVRSTVLQQVGVYRPAFEGAEDYDLWVRIAEVAQVANLPECLLQYREHPASVTHRARVRQLFSTRLVQLAAQARRTSGRDPTTALTAPPDWRAAESLNAPTYPDLARLYRLLELADVANPADPERDPIDLAVLTDRHIVLNHAERRMAQLALLNLLKSGAAPQGATRADVLRHFIRLHPARAIRLGYHALLKG
jgi:glycosyltransferase involved in cell wall biosynthesis